MERKPETPEEKAKRKRRRELNDIVVVLNTPEGRRLIWRILSVVQVFLDSFCSGDNGYTTSYNAGRRSVGLWLLSESLDAKPDALTAMQREYASELKREELEEEEYIKNIDILKTDS